MRWIRFRKIKSRKIKGKDFITTSVAFTRDQFNYLKMKQNQGEFLRSLLDAYMTFERKAEKDKVEELESELDRLDSLIERAMIDKEKAWRQEIDNDGNVTVFFISHDDSLEKDYSLFECLKHICEERRAVKQRFEKAKQKRLHLWRSWPTLVEYEDESEE